MKLDNSKVKFDRLINDLSEDSSASRIWKDRDRMDEG